MHKKIYKNRYTFITNVSGFYYRLDFLLEIVLFLLCALSHVE
ncbi:hypothetical protein protein [Bacillus cereus G9241]|nr:hypothetical protein protein [Bacillus cereus G9241]